MTIKNISYKVTHYPGDPREPEYKNGLPVSSVTYQEGDIHLVFSIVGEPSSNSESIEWKIIAAPNIRKALGKHWNERSLVFDRVIEHLKSIDTSNVRHMSGKKFERVTVDTSKVRSWLSTKVEELEERFIWLKLSPPPRNIFILQLVALGAYLAQEEISRQTSVFLSLIGTASIFLLAKRAHRDYKFSQGIVAMSALSSKNYNWGKSNLALSTIKLMFHHYGRRYVVTAFLSALLIYIGNKGPGGVIF